MVLAPGQGALGGSDGGSDGRREWVRSIAAARGNDTAAPPASGWVWKERVVKHLKVLAGLGVWDDRRIAAGADWEAEIARAIADCNLALLLVSADFLTSRVILGQEVPPLLQRRQAQGVRVVPLIPSPCAWNRVPWLRAISARPKDGQPLSGMSRHAAEAALAEQFGGTDSTPPRYTLSLRRHHAPVRAGMPRV